MNLVNLPSDIIYEITKYISLQDISHMKVSSNILNKKINTIQNSIVTYNLKIYDGKKYLKVTTSDLFYKFINYYLITHLSKYKKEFIKEFYWNKNRLNKTFFKYYILNFEETHNYTIKNFTSNAIINYMFHKIFIYYVLNDFINIKFYPNLLELFAFYNYIQIEIYQSVYNFKYMFNFLESSNDSMYYDIKIKYYNYILDTLHTNNALFTFDQMFKMSSYIISIPVIKRILGYKILNLDNSKLNLCCYNCNEENLREICNTKKIFWNDNLISHNYNELKRLLQKYNMYYYTIILNYETSIINEIIYIKNPITNKRLRLNGYKFYNLMNFLEVNMTEYYIKTTNVIKKHQMYLRNKFFT